jgi:hypothetical protein
MRRVHKAWGRFAALLLLPVLGCSQRLGLVPGVDLNQTMAPLFPGAHAPAGITSRTVDGVATDSRSSGATDDGTTLVLSSGSGGLEWAVYRLNTGSAPVSFTVSLGSTAGEEAFVGVADFDAGRWVFDGPTSGDYVHIIAGPNFRSPSGNVFVVIAAVDGHMAHVNNVGLTFDNGYFEQEDNDSIAQANVISAFPFDITGNTNHSETWPN